MSKLSLIGTIENPKYSNLPLKFFVEFAYSCANETRPLINQECLIKSLDVVALWLEDKATKQEVIYEATMSPRYNTYNSVDAACGVIAFSSGPHYAQLSAYNAARTLNPNNPKVKEQEYARRFLDKVNALTKVEKVLYGIE